MFYVHAFTTISLFINVKFTIYVLKNWSYHNLLKQKPRLKFIERLCLLMVGAVLLLNGLNIRKQLSMHDASN